ncbi:hypothetical protein OsJ_23362 [Oryza sativa Japonica Group]|uniref:Uncharacterized protein n=1 Tax=Oryza sativa subsp. japonica TaxID=39947 RepID=B9FVW2_ORYSJ|nr:hypothetical protein OsJ_23362 [Oryza sativa Japonica Group]
MHGVLTSPCLRPPPLLRRAFPSPATRLLPPQTLALRPLPLPRGLRSSPPPPRAAAEAAAFGGGRAAGPALDAGGRPAERQPRAAAGAGGRGDFGGGAPFSALRDLCDPFLALCREVMPPVFGRKLDLSPLIAFMAIDIIIMILRPQPRM